MKIDTSKLQGKIANLQAEIGKTQGDLSAEKAKLAGTQGTIAEAKTERAGALRDVDGYQKQATSLRNEAQSLREQAKVELQKATGSRGAHAMQSFAAAMGKLFGFAKSHTSVTTEQVKGDVDASKTAQALLAQADAKDAAALDAHGASKAAWTHATALVSTIDGHQKTAANHLAAIATLEGTLAKTTEHKAHAETALKFANTAQRAIDATASFFSGLAHDVTSTVGQEWNALKADVKQNAATEWQALKADVKQGIHGLFQAGLEALQRITEPRTAGAGAGAAGNVVVHAEPKPTTSPGVVELAKVNGNAVHGIANGATAATVAKAASLFIGAPKSDVSQPAGPAVSVASSSPVAQHARAAEFALLQKHDRHERVRFEAFSLGLSLVDKSGHEVAPGALKDAIANSGASLTKSRNPSVFDSVQHLAARYGLKGLDARNPTASDLARIADAQAQRRELGLSVLATASDVVKAQAAGGSAPPPNNNNGTAAAGGGGPPNGPGPSTDVSKPGGPSSSPVAQHARAAEFALLQKHDGHERVRFEAFSLGLSLVDKSGHELAPGALKDAIANNGASLTKSRNPSVFDSVQHLAARYGLKGLDARNLSADDFARIADAQAQRRELGLSVLATASDVVKARG
jgi:hypothetical protein